VKEEGQGAITMERENGRRHGLKRGYGISLAENGKMEKGDANRPRCACGGEKI